MPTIVLNQSARIEFDGEKPLLELDDEILFGCRSGKCGICMIKVTHGIERISPRNEREERLLELLGETDVLTRLACQCTVFGDVEIEIME